MICGYSCDQHNATTRSRSTRHGGERPSTVTRLWKSENGHHRSAQPWPESPLWTTDAQKGTIPTMSDLSSIRIGPLNLRDIVWLLSLVAAGVGGYMAFERRLTISEERMTNHAMSADKMAASVDKLNHFTTATEEVAKMNERRISTLEAQYNIMSPKLERIDTNIQWLTREKGRE